MLIKLMSATLVGIDAHRVDIETYLANHEKRFTLVGLPDGVIKEAKDRVRCAIENSGYYFPDKEIIVNLAPASLPKIGSGFDLGIALGILAVSGFVKTSLLHSLVCVGEVALDGNIKSTGLEVSTALLLKEEKSDHVLVVSDTARENIDFISGINVLTASSLRELLYILNSDSITIAKTTGCARVCERKEGYKRAFSEVIGQKIAKRAIEIAAAGGHNMLMVGPPGGGKTMLAERMVSILPPLSQEEMYSVNKIHAAVRTLNHRDVRFSPIMERQFRTPHHSISLAGLVGGGRQVAPGEISLSHRGILFLDELPELRRDVLEALREPLEKRKVSISRAQCKLSYPADFILVAAMNPCPCGMRGMRDENKNSHDNYQRRCSCSESEVHRYVKKISGPLLDRIDIQIWIPPLDISEIKLGKEEPSIDEEMRLRVACARDIQAKRYARSSRLNSHMYPSEIKKFCELDDPSFEIIKNASKKFNLSTRAYSRILKVSRTIADMENQKDIGIHHVIEALSYRVQVSLL